jgi:hypothetical protein
MRRPDVGMLALGLFGVIAVLIGVMIFRFIYFDRSGVTARGRRGSR